MDTIHNRLIFYCDCPRTGMLEFEITMYRHSPTDFSNTGVRMCLRQRPRAAKQGGMDRRNAGPCEIHSVLWPTHLVASIFQGCYFLTENFGEHSIKTMLQVLLEVLLVDSLIDNYSLDWNFVYKSPSVRTRSFRSRITVIGQR